jgi:hypothetical protein
VLVARAVPLMAHYVRPFEGPTVVREKNDYVTDERPELPIW